MGDLIDLVQVHEPELAVEKSFDWDADRSHIFWVSLCYAASERRYNEASINENQKVGLSN